MPLALLPLEAHPRVIVDWVEIACIVSDFRTYNLSDLARVWDVRKNTEESDFESIEDATEDSFLESVSEEIRFRLECLEDSYPFELSDADELILRDDLSDGAVAYLFCLFMSHPDKDEVINGAVLPVIDNRVRDLFQVCSTVAAAGHVSGNSISFGFPRPDGTGFLEKLRETYRLFGEGTVRERQLPGTPRNPKDDGVDIIAWQPSVDNAPGKFYFLGQVASGNNWPGKSMLSILDKFHESWFEVRPASLPNPSIFIPFHLRPIDDEELNDTIRARTVEFGTVFYRLRIPKLVDKGIAAANAGFCVERTDEMAQVADWVNSTADAFRAGGRA